MRTAKPGMMAKDYFQISITHIPTGNDVSFDAWVTGFADSFASSWKGTPVYGRMDDLYNFQKTSRKISLAFDVVAANKFEAAKNVRKLNKLAQFLYPVYSAPQGDMGTPNSQTLQAAPLLKIKWNGLISNALDGAGLVGFLNGFSYSPEIDSGQFFVKGRGSGKPFMAYQLHRVQFEYTVLHTHLTGWTTRTVDLGGGVSKHIFGGDERRELGSTFPHAVSDPIILPVEGDAADETEPDPAAPGVPRDEDGYDAKEENNVCNGDFGDPDCDDIDWDAYSKLPGNMGVTSRSKAKGRMIATPFPPDHNPEIVESQQGQILNDSGHATLDVVPGEGPPGY